MTFPELWKYLEDDEVTDLDFNCGNIWQSKVSEIPMRVEDAADRCKLSPPTFRKRAKQWLMPGKYGKLPYEFFAGRDFYEKPPEEEDKSIKYDDSKQYNALELPTLGV